MIYHIVFVLIPQPWNSHQQHVFCYVWHMPSFMLTIFDTEFMALSYPQSCIKIAYYSSLFSEVCSSSLFWGKLFIGRRLFVKINISYFNAFPLLSSNIGQCIWLRSLSRPITLLIFARFLRNFTCTCMIEWKIFMHKISQAYIVLAYGKPFITELLNNPRIHERKDADNRQIFVQIIKVVLKFDKSSE